MGRVLPWVWRQGQNLLEQLQGLWEGALDVLYPAQPVCPWCDRTFHALGFQVLCLDCFEELSLRERWQPVAVHPGAPLGPVGALGLYQGSLRQAVHRMKFRAHRRLALALGYLMGALALDHGPSQRVDAVVPVPLHPQRAWQRGFNQASLLAAAAARVLYRPVWEEVLVRARMTRQQAGLQQSQRQGNVAGAFSVSQDGKVRGRRLLLVDDVMTTGSTLREAARALTEAGAAEVLALVVAEAPLRGGPAEDRGGGEGDGLIKEEAFCKRHPAGRGEDAVRSECFGGRLSGGGSGHEGT